MEICQSCGKSFPDGALLDVFLTKGGQLTQHLLCRECGLRATQGLHAMEIKPEKSKNVEVFDREKARQEHEKAVILLDAGKYRDALHIFKQVLTSTADDPEPMNYLNIAVCHAYLNEFKESLTILEEAIQRWPNNDRLRMNYEGIKQDADTAHQREKERAALESKRLKEKQEFESKKLAVELRKKEIQAHRRTSQQCIMCGKPISSLYRFFYGLERVQHKHCTQYIE